MGICCQSLKDDGKIEGLLDAYEKRFGIGLCDFPYSSRQLDLYSSQSLIETVRIPILTHSLGIKIRGKLIPGSAPLFSFFEQGLGWSQKRAAMLCSLCCTGLNQDKCNYLVKIYGKVPGKLSKAEAQELVSDAITLALLLFPKSAIDLYSEDWNDDTVMKVRSYADQLEREAGRVRDYLVASIPWKEDCEVDVIELNERMTSGTLKVLCSSAGLRRLASISKHEYG